MSFLQEFKSFAMRGNAVDMAVGIIIGASFGKIVSSLVNDLLMPPIGLLVGGMDFSDLGITLRSATETAPAVVMKYGVFINIMIDFTIVAFALFVVIKAMNKFTRQDTPAPVQAPAPTTKECPECLMTIPINAKRCGYCTSKL